ncbi:ABC transporter permease [Corynebacterium aquilae]|uniref:ABC transporter permease n=1 Tax=Corynebacterium aquilae DSM 44791 TaxID=1431546 RepID=A0A1L7CI90_9CORY|nr:ABC transporter permease subunit [Corynebacterium aquilae]APT85571.1 ABC transporter permease [Corynebacterium aquilae DSM 44791]
MLDALQGVDVGWRLAQHLGYSFLALAIALIIALPIGLAIGHTGKGTGIVLATSGALRALPTLGLVTWLALALPMGVTRPLVPATIVLVVLGVPPILAAVQSGVAAIDRPIIDAANAMGYSPAQVIREVEIPLAAGPIIGGIRSSMLQIIATATIAAYIGLGGLGRLLLDGLAVRDFPQMIAGALLVAISALVIDAPLALAQKRLEHN